MDTGVIWDRRGRKRLEVGWSDIGTDEHEHQACFPSKSPDGKTAVIIFLIGLVSEQITSLTYKRDA